MTLSSAKRQPRRRSATRRGRRGRRRRRRRPPRRFPSLCGARTRAYAPSSKPRSVRSRRKPRSWLACATSGARWTTWRWRAPRASRRRTSAGGCLCRISLRTRAPTICRSATCPSSSRDTRAWRCSTRRSREAQRRCSRIWGAEMGERAVQATFRELPRTRRAPADAARRKSPTSTAWPPSRRVRRRRRRPRTRRARRTRSRGWSSAGRATRRPRETRRSPGCDASRR
mmetsp:Transcript_7692/g.32695  ORF Transcript_7692/g.32695 Transcript_7692/m.32695 type:complete len:228 (-) Transcript_7692:78-761(-)